MNRIPQFSSLEEMEAFWQANSPLDFEDELEEIVEPVFVRANTIEVILQPQEIESVTKLADVQGLAKEELVRQWVREKLQFA
ncbi:MAG: hypothetical protein FJ010_09985 [Chloroflexi bacterium]|nr:hypothetical protein [Chloroflexota bacterium]